MLLVEDPLTYASGLLVMMGRYALGLHPSITPLVVFASFAIQLMRS